MDYNKSSGEEAGATEKPMESASGTRIYSSDVGLEETSQSVTQNAQSKDAREGATPDDTDIVDWEGEGDPHKPMNWTNARKAKNIVVICYCTFLTPLGSTMVRSSLHFICHLIAPLTVTVCTRDFRGYGNL
jgi:hypothetical protein